MLQELLQAISRPASNIAFTYPSSSGVGGPTVGPQAVFSKLLNMLSGGANGGNFLSSYTAMQAQQQNMNPAAQAYLNSLQGTNGVTNGTSNNQREAFAPGSVVSSSQTMPALQTAYNPSQAIFASQVMNPLQGFAGQAGVAGSIPGGIGTTGLPGSLPGSLGGGLPGSYGYSPTGYGSTGFGKLSMFIMPLVSLVGLVKSLFGLRGATGSEQAVRIDKNKLDYVASLENYRKEQSTDGSFDEDAYWGEGASSDEGNFDSSKLEM